MLKIITKQLQQCNYYKEDQCPQCQHYKECLLNLPPNKTLDKLYTKIQDIQKEIQYKKEKIAYIKGLKVDIQSQLHNETIIMKIRKEIKDFTYLLRQLRKDEHRIVKQLRIKRDRRIKQ